MKAFKKLVIGIVAAAVMMSSPVTALADETTAASQPDGTTAATTGESTTSTFDISKLSFDTMYGNQVIDCNVPPTSTMTAAQMRVHDILATNGISSGHVWVDLTTINNVTAIYCQWTIDQNADQVADAVVGQFPDPISWDTYKATSFCWKSYVAPI